MNGHVVIVRKSEQSYLAHAGFVQRAKGAVSTAGNAVKNAGSLVGQNVKYVAREMRPNGKFDYWYSMDEYRAHLQAQANKGKQAAQNAVSNAKAAGQNAVNKAGQTGQNALNTAGQAAQKVADRASSAADQAKEAAVTVKSKGNRMREEFRKNVSDTASKAEDTAKKAAGAVKDIAEKSVDKVKDTATEVSDTVKNTAEKAVDKAKETASKAVETVKDTAESAADKAKDTAEKAAETAKETAENLKDKLLKKDSQKSQYGEYKEDDPDFADANYDKASRIGDTDFLTFKRDDGTSVILEEDMKWVLPKGVDANDPAIKKAIQGFANEVESARSMGKDDYSFEEWRDAVTEAIDKASRKNSK